MLYTVIPLESIYKESEEKNKEKAENKEIIIPNGRVCTKRDGDKYVIERVVSTDMKDYLNMEYMPGSEWKES